MLQFINVLDDSGGDVELPSNWPLFSTLRVAAGLSEYTFPQDSQLKTFEVGASD